jgi:hypothetical protein
MENFILGKEYTFEQIEESLVIHQILLESGNSRCYCKSDRSGGLLIPEESEETMAKVMAYRNSGAFTRTFLEQLKVVKKGIQLIVW